MKRFIIMVLLFLLYLTTINLQSESEKEMAKSVFKQLYACMPTDFKINYPIKFEITENDETNAYASKDSKKKGLYKITITTGMLKDVVQTIPDRAAMIIGHEMAHISLGHVDKNHQNNSDFMNTQFTRQNEIDADTVGLKYALTAGYSYEKALGVIKQMLNLGMEYNSFEGLASDHPSWKERLIYIDKYQSNLWKSMAAFDNGVFFLGAEQYSPAVYCFRSVIKEFPNCYEAWANLGYAYLMQYCDAFEPEDLKKYDLYQIAMGGFYTKAESLESSVRGVDEDLWWEAVGAFKEAIRLKGDLALVKANLGIAYLLSPAGKDVGKAEKNFQEAIDITASDSTLDDLNKSYIYYNAGITYLSSGDLTNSQLRFDKAEEYESKYFAEFYPGSKYSYMKNFMLFNRALTLMKDTDNNKKRDSRDYFESYLKSTNPLSIWWKLAYMYYSDLSDKLTLNKLSESELKTKMKTIFKPVISLNINSNKIITLSDPIENVSELLKDYDITQIIVAMKTNLKKISITELGCDILASDKVIAIFLKSKNPNPITLQSIGLSTEKKNINVGMKMSDFEDIIGEEKDNYTYRQFFETDKNYRFYKNLGICLRINNSNKTIDELVIAKIY